MTFASLYDEHERQVYNLCLRITGSHEDAADATQEAFLEVLERHEQLERRDVNLAAYLMTVARHASYDAIERRRRALPTDELPESPAPAADGPEGHALLDAHQEQIRVANLSLPPRQREVLALRELAELSYDEVAQVMGMNRNSVAQLISRARINLHDGLRRTALGSVASASPQCDRALPLLAMRQDGMLDGDAGWLDGHLAGCATCRVRREAMDEAAVAYRQWLPLPAALWLREAVARAAGRTGARAGLRMAAAAAVAVVAIAVLGVAEAQTPTRTVAAAYQPLTVPGAVVPDDPAPRAMKARRVASRRPAPALRRRTSAPAPAPVPTAVPIVAAEAVEVAPRPRRRARPAPTATPAPAPAVPSPEPTATPTPEPPPPPPPEEEPTPQPPRPPVCETCGIVAPAPPNGPVP